MGRAERRKQQRTFRRKLTDKQFETLMAKSDGTAVKCEVDNQMKFYQELWSRSLIKAFKDNGISDVKAKMVLDSIEANMARELEAKRNNK